MTHKLTRLTSLLLAVIMSFSMLLVPAEAASFSDVPSKAWYKAAVDYAYEQGWMAGTGSNVFEPNQEVTRGMAVTVLARFAKAETDNGSPAFLDTAAGKWYTGAAAWAVEQGIVAGTGDGQFAPNRSISRQELCAILVKYLEVAGIQLKQGESLSFTDEDRISGYAKQAVAFCGSVGLIGGFTDGSFRPKSSATRAQLAQILMRLDSLIRGESSPVVPMPAQSFAGGEQDGISVNVEAPEGALPANTSMRVSAVTDESALADIARQVNGTVYAAADISFSKDGAEIEPAAEVEVQIALDGLESLKNPTVVHVKKDGSVELVYSELISGSRSSSKDTVRFFARDFSVYAVVDNDVDPAARLLVRFWTPVFAADGTFTLEAKDENSVYVTRVDVTNVENVNYLPTIIPDPTVEQPTGKLMFFGWSFNKDYTEEEADGSHTINYVRDQIGKLLKDETNDAAAVPFQIKDGETVLNVYPIVYNYFTVSYKDENGDASLGTDIYYTHDTSKTITIQQQYSPYEQGYRFSGWIADGSETIYENGETYTLTETDTVFLAQVQEGYWLSFAENPGNHYKGATYHPPVFCPNGVIPSNARPANPTLSGYNFEDWYRTFNAGDVAANDSWSDRFSFTSTLNQDTTVYAKWNAKSTTDYTVIVWKQRVTDSKNAADANKNWDFAFSTTLTGTPGAAVSGLNLSAYQNKDGQKITVNGVEYDFLGFKYNSAKGVVSTDTVLQQNGSTIVNLYYDRELVTFNFYNPTYTAISSYSNVDLDTYNYYASVCGGRYQVRQVNDTYYYVGLIPYDVSVEYRSSYTFCTVIDGYYRVLTWSSNANTWYTTVNNTTYRYDEGDFTRLYVRISSGTTVYRESFSSTSSLSLSGLFGQALETYPGYSWPGGYWWYEGDGKPGNTRTTFLADFLPAGTNMTINYYGVQSSGTSMVYWYKQSLTDPTNYPLANSVSSGSGEFNLSDKYTGFTCYAYSSSSSSGPWTEVGNLMTPEGSTALYYDADPTTDGYQAVPDVENLYILFNRNQYAITYNYGAFVDRNDEAVEGVSYSGILHRETGIYYEAPLDEYEAGGAKAYDPIQAGTFTDPAYVFEGWYTDESCSTKYVFTGQTMPEGGVNLYAKFRLKYYRVFLEGNEPDDANVDWVGQQSMNFLIPYEGLISNGNAIEGSDSTEQYVLVGWYTDPELETIFNFSTRLTEDLALDYPKTEDTEGDGTNGDVDRPWVTNKVILYAKWRKVLQGANGIHVTYDSVESNETGHSGVFTEEGSQTTVWNDPLIYFDQATAIARSAATPDLPEDWQFLYWDVLNAQGNSSGQIVYPGGAYTVNANDAAEEAVNPNAAPFQEETRGGMRAVTTSYYTRSTTPTIGKSYLLVCTYQNKTYVVSNVYYATDDCPYMVPVTITTDSNGYQIAMDDTTHGSDLNAFRFLTGGTSNALTLFNESKGYLVFDNEGFPAFASATGSYGTWRWNTSSVRNNGWYNSPAISGDTYYYLGVTTPENATSPLYATASQGQTAFVLYEYVTTTTYSLDEALNVEGGDLHFTSTGTYPWTAVEDASTGAVYARSGNKGVHSSTSTVSTTVTLNAGDRLKFKWRVSSEANYDYLHFYVNGSEINAVPAISGNGSWTEISLNVNTAGTYTLAWTYSKDGSTSSNEDYGYLDDVELVRASATHTVTFVDWDGTVLKTQTVAEGESATPPADPSREGYTFAGWSGNYTNVTQDETVTATYTQNSEQGYYVWTPTDTIVPGQEYLIGFQVGGNVYLAVNYNESATNHYYYNISSNYYGYTALATLEGQNVVGVSGNASDLQYCTWVFSTAAGGTISSGYNSSYYLVTYSNTNYGDLYPNSSTSNGTNWSWDASAHTLSRAVNGTTRYAEYYSSGSSSLMRVTSSLPSGSSVQLYSKVYVEPTVYHTVTFVDGHTNEIIETQQVEDGKDAVAPGAPDHSEENYIFDHWDTDFTAVTGDLVVTAVYRFEKEGYYIVTFKNWNGTVLKTEEVAEHGAATAPEAPTRNGYTFRGWDKAFDDVTSNLVVRAVFSRTITKSYTVTLRAVYGPVERLKTTHVTWYANNGTEDDASRKDSAVVVINGEIEIEDQSSYQALSMDGFSFLGWARLPEIPAAANAAGYNGRYTTYVDSEGNTKINSYTGLTEADLWLVYHPVAGDHEAYFTVNENGIDADREFNYIAANERTPYHGLYAVWKRDVFYILHSSTGELEAVSLPVSSTDGVTRTGTVDLTSFVEPGYLYAGYYTDKSGDGLAYGYVRHNFVQQIADAYTASAAAANWTASGSAASAEAVTVATTTLADQNVNFIPYRGDSLYTNGLNTPYSKDENGKIIKDADGNVIKSPAVWNKADAETANGTNMTPAANTVYYLKEVPSYYLSSKVLFTYDIADRNKIIDLWLVSVLDDANYGSAGFYVNPESTLVSTDIGSFKAKTSLSNTFILVQNAKNESGEVTPVATQITAATYGLKNGPILVTHLTELAAAQNTFTMLPAWTTPDGVEVKNNGLTFNFAERSTDESQDPTAPTALLTWSRSFDGTEKLYLNLDGKHGLGGADDWNDYSVTVMHLVGPNNTEANVIAKETDHAGIYEVTVPKGAWTEFLLVRCDPNHLAEDFSNLWSTDNPKVKWDQTNNIQFHCSNNLQGANVSGKESYENYLTGFYANSYDATWSHYPAIPS